MTATLEFPLDADALAPFAAGGPIGWAVALAFVLLLLTAVRLRAELPRPAVRLSGRTIRSLRRRPNPKAIRHEEPFDVRSRVFRRLAPCSDLPVTVPARRLTRPVRRGVPFISSVRLDCRGAAVATTASDLMLVVLGLVALGAALVGVAKLLGRATWADGFFAAAGNNLYAHMRGRVRWRIEVVSRPPDKKGWVKLPRRWVVERTFAWIGRYRANSKDYERCNKSSEGMIYTGMTRLMLNRLSPGPKGPPFRYKRKIA